MPDFFSEDVTAANAIPSYEYREVNKASRLLCNLLLPDHRLFNETNGLSGTEYSDMEVGLK